MLHNVNLLAMDLSKLVSITHSSTLEEKVLRPTTRDTPELWWNWTLISSQANSLVNLVMFPTSNAVVLRYAM